MPASGPPRSWFCTACPVPTSGAVPAGSPHRRPRPRLGDRRLRRRAGERSSLRGACQAKPSVARTHAPVQTRTSLCLPELRPLWGQGATGEPPLALRPPRRQRPAGIGRLQQIRLAIGVLWSISTNMRWLPDRPAIGVFCPVSSSDSDTEWAPPQCGPFGTPVWPSPPGKNRTGFPEASGSAAEPEATSCIRPAHPSGTIP